MSRRLRVMTYNLKGLQLDVEALTAVVRAVDPDVLGIQEPPRGPMRGRRLRALAASTGMRVAVGGYAARTTSLLVADRVATVTDARGVRLRWWGTRSRMRSFTRRGFAIATVDGIRVVVVHLSLDPVERARHLTRILSEVPTGSPALGLVMGDVNEPPGGPVWTRLGAGLLDAAADRSQPTFPAGRPRRRIDAVFVDPRATVLDVHVVDDGSVARASDHRPVVVDLEVPS